jgi:hypothetical protein
LLSNAACTATPRAWCWTRGGTWPRCGTPRGCWRNPKRPPVGLYKLNSVYPIELESAWFQPLNLKGDFLVSKMLLSNSTCTATPRRYERRAADTNSFEPAGLARLRCCRGRRRRRGGIARGALARRRAPAAVAGRSRHRAGAANDYCCGGGGGRGGRGDCPLSVVGLYKLNSAYHP